MRQTRTKVREYELGKQSLLSNTSNTGRKHTQNLEKKTRSNKEFKVLRGQIKEEVRNYSLSLDAAIRFECKKGPV